MSTPDFVAQNSTNFTTIRYYASEDPYYYTVDNRPLTDIETNLVALRQYGADGARRAIMLETLSSALRLRELAPIPSGYTYRAMGFQVGYPSTGQVTVGQGAILLSETTAVSLTSSILKAAALLDTQTFSTPAPGTAGQSIVYTIEGQIYDLTTTNMATSALPYVDSNNNYLTSTLFTKELKLTLNTGVAATTGTEAAPSTTSGKFPLYNVTATNGSTSVRVWAHPNSPYFKGINRRVLFENMASGGGTATQINLTNVVQLADGATSGVMVQVPLEELNPFNSLRLKIGFIPSAASNNMVFRVRTLGLSSGDSASGGYTSQANETLAITAGASALQLSTLTTTIPNTLFAGSVSNIWSVNKDRLTLLLERVGADGSDTNTGTASISDVILFQ